MSAGRPAVAFDARPLTEAVDARAIRESARRARAERTPGSSAGIVGAGIGFAVLGVALLFIFGTVAANLANAVGAVIAGRTSGGSVVGALVPLLVVGGMAAFIVVAVVGSRRKSAERSYRLSRFAAANGMTHVPRVDEPRLPGMIFGRGSDRHALDIVRGAQPRFVEFANYSFVTGSGKSRSVHRWGYVAVKLDVPLPHIILDAVGNNGLFGSNLPAAFDKTQRLGLEGDFDRYFSLYCPRGYERDALYLFTPDIMARFIDHAAELDVEIVDDWLFLYAKRDLSTLDPATWAWLFAAVAALLDKFAQWARWRDERLAGAHSAVGDAVASGIPGATPGPVPALQPPPGVAPPGRRLKTRIPWVSILVFVGVAAAWFLLQVVLR